MLQGDLRAFVRQLSKEKGLDADVVKAAIEEAVVVASKKNLSSFRDAKCELNMDTGKLELRVLKTVVKISGNLRTEISLSDAKKIKEDVAIGEDVLVPVEPEAFGRIAAQSARQFVMQRLRDAERTKVVGEYVERVGELVSGEVLRTERIFRFEKQDIIIKLPKGEGVLPANQTPHPTRHRPGDRLKLLITGVDPNARGPLVILSRTHPQLVAKLFEQEVPEIADGVVEVLGVAREPGVRSKIAVHSKNPDVDPVGACVGMKGSRVQMVVSELEGERIDIVEYHSDPAKFIRNALNPADILSVSCDPEKMTADVLVARGNLSLAIGKRGQNARLAAKLTDYKIDIRSEEEAGDKAEELANAEIERRYLEDFLAQIEALTSQQITAFGKQEFNTVEKIATAGLDRLKRVLGDEELARIVEAGAHEYMQALKEMQVDSEPVEAPAAEASASEAAPAAAATEEAKASPSDAVAEEPKE